MGSVIQRAAARGRNHRVWKPLHVIGIDEVSRVKAQRCMTLVCDLVRRRVVWIADNPYAATIERFFEWLLKRPARSIRVIWWPMWTI